MDDLTLTQKRHREICDDIHEMYLKKNIEYGNSFSELYNDLGIISAVTQITHKYNRLKNLAKDNSNNINVAYESITDTLLDMANYCIMTIIEMHKEDTCEHEWQYSGQTSSGHEYVCKKCKATKILSAEAVYAAEKLQLETLTI